MSKYQEQHYEDMAGIVKMFTGSCGLEHCDACATVSEISLQFMRLFAADNPACCAHCGDDEGTTAACVGAGGRSYDEHNFEGGFDRERFLKACGLGE